jgi:hypothetical protein
MDLKHTSKVQECIKVFLGLMLEIKDVADEYMLSHFMKGLQPWVKNAL